MTALNWQHKSFFQKLGLLFGLVSGIFLVQLLFLNTADAAAGSRLTTGDAAVTVYSGPGFRYRPILTITKKTELPASSRIYQGKDGDFYKVLITYKTGRRAVGYINVNSEVDLNINDRTAEDIEAYKDLGLAESAMQVGFHTIKNSKVFWTLGYQKYPAPSFYLKALIGQLLSETASSLLAGAEAPRNR